MKRRISWASWIALAAIVGVIAAIAIPSYGDYTHRAQLSEAVSLLGAAKTPLAEYYAQHRKWPDSLDKIVAARDGKYTQNLAITRGAGGAGELELTATLRVDGVDRRVAGKSVRFQSADGGKTWICRPGTAENRHLPAACRPEN